MANRKSSSSKSQKNKRSKNKKAPPQVSLERRLKAWELRTQQRMTLREITVELNGLFPKYPLKSDHQAVAKMLEETEKEYREEHADRIESLKLELLALKNYVIREAVQAWERSKEPEKAIEKLGEKISKQTARDQDGDHRYLQAILAAVEDIEKSFGMDKSSPPPLVNLQIDFGNLTTQQIVAIKNAKTSEEVISIITASNAG